MDVKIKDIIVELEQFAPLSLQESYDNAGLICGNISKICTGVLFTIDTLESTVDEAIMKKVNLIVSHHPIVFKGLKKLTGKNYIERTLIKAIKNDVAIYAAHTNIDNVINGVNAKICSILYLNNCSILRPKKSTLKKLVTFIPQSHVNSVEEAIFSQGAGHIGNYYNCGFKVEGLGSFKASEGANPYVGAIGTIHYEKEMRFETIFPEYLQEKTIKALLKAHPYEEVAYDIYSLDNFNPQIGAGMVGELKKPVSELEFLDFLKKKLKISCIRHTKLLGKQISKIALCGGSGSFLLKDAINRKADIFITADFKYHEFFDAENKIIIADIGHFESEQLTKELFYDILTNKFPNFAFYFSENSTNPINYY